MKTVRRCWRDGRRGGFLPYLSLLLTARGGQSLKTALRCPGIQAQHRLKEIHYNSGEGREQVRRGNFSMILVDTAQ